MSKIKIPISERIASKLVAENENNLTGEIIASTTVFKDANGVAIFEMTREVRDDQYYTSYSMFADKYKQGE